MRKRDHQESLPLLNCPSTQTYHLPVEISTWDGSYCPLLGHPIGIQRHDLPPTLSSSLWCMPEIASKTEQFWSLLESTLWSKLKPEMHCLSKWRSGSRPNHTSPGTPIENATQRTYLHVPTCAYTCLHVPTCAYMCLHVPACAYMCLLVFYWHVPSYRCLWLLFGSELSCFI